MYTFGNPFVNPNVTPILKCMAKRHKDSLEDMGGKQKRFASRASEAAKADLRKALDAHPHSDMKTEAAFINQCVATFVSQMRRGEIPVVPLEFVFQNESVPPQKKQSRTKPS